MTAILFRFILILPVFIVATTSIGWSAPACPLSYGTTDSAKSNKLYLYFPTFDVQDLNSTIGTTAELRDRIYDVVADDYCEFNVQAIPSATVNPEPTPAPPDLPARRVIVTIGSDTGSDWGFAGVVDLNDSLPTGYPRIWAGKYNFCEGGPGFGGNPASCSQTGALTGVNATLNRWAQAIGGTVAHEAAHTYGLTHNIDNPSDYAAAPGVVGNPPHTDTTYTKYLMPTGLLLTGEHRAGFRRYFSDRAYGLLATNVGLSVQTMHNWDLVNPNSAEARSLTIEFLSSQSTISNPSWSFRGASSPWIDPVVTKLQGSDTFKGNTYHKYKVTWSTGNPSWTNPGPGILPGGSNFHIGATFTGVDFNQPDPIIIQNVTLFGANSQPLALHPRLPMYNSGTFNLSAGTFALNFFQPPNATQLIMQDAVIYQLPRVASIESMSGDGRPFTYDNIPIIPWSTSTCEETSQTKTIATQRKTMQCVIANISSEPHVKITHKIGEKGVYDCSKGVPDVRPPHDYSGSQDSPNSPDYEGPICAGTTRDPFPSTTIYIIATFIDPNAKHFDPEKKEYVVGPVTSKVYYQFAGVRDLDMIGKSKTNVNDDKDPTQFGEQVTFTASVAPAMPAVVEDTPTGTVQFILDGVKAGNPVMIDSKGQATWSTSILKVGQHSVSANYVPSPDSPFLASSSPDEDHSVIEVIEWCFWLIILIFVILMLLVIWRFLR